MGNIGYIYALNRGERENSMEMLGQTFSFFLFFLLGHKPVKENMSHMPKRGRLMPVPKIDNQSIDES